MNFNTEQFIDEVQQREAVWNCQRAVYKDKVLKCKQWEELVEIFGKEDMKDADRNYVRRELQKKWRNIRDNFVKTLRDSTKSGSAKKHKYIYYKNLMFLKDTVSMNETNSNVQREEDDSNITEEDSFLVERKPSKRNKRIKEEHIQIKEEIDDMTDESNDIDNVPKNVEFINVEEDEDRLFCLSLVNEIKKVPEHLRLRTKVQLLQVITDAQASRYCTSTSTRKRKS